MENISQLSAEERDRCIKFTDALGRRFNFLIYWESICAVGPTRDVLPSIHQSCRTTAILNHCILLEKAGQYISPHIPFFVDNQSILHQFQHISATVGV